MDILKAKLSVKPDEESYVASLSIGEHCISDRGSSEFEAMLHLATSSKHLSALPWETITQSPEDIANTLRFAADMVALGGGFVSTCGSDTEYLFVFFNSWRHAARIARDSLKGFARDKKFVIGDGAIEPGECVIRIGLQNYSYFSEGFIAYVYGEEEEGLPSGSFEGETRGEAIRHAARCAFAERNRARHALLWCATMLDIRADGFPDLGDMSLDVGIIIETWEEEIAKIRREDELNKLGEAEKHTLEGDTQSEAIRNLACAVNDTDLFEAMQWYADCLDAGECSIGLSDQAGKLELPVDLLMVSWGQAKGDVEPGSFDIRLSDKGEYLASYRRYHPAHDGDLMSFGRGRTLESAIFNLSLMFGEKSDIRAALQWYSANLPTDPDKEHSHIRDILDDWRAHEPTAKATPGENEQVGALTNFEIEVGNIEDELKSLQEALDEAGYESLGDEAESALTLLRKLKRSIKRNRLKHQGEASNERQEPQCTEDEVVYGEGAWVYCAQHMNAHPTGWCTVSVRDKLGLGIVGHEKGKEAIEKCKAFGLELVDRPD
jgi:hypothetical protein